MYNLGEYLKTPFTFRGFYSRIFSVMMLLFSLKEWSTNHDRNDTFTFATGDWNKVFIKFDSTDQVSFSHFSIHHQGRIIDLNQEEGCETIWFDNYDENHVAMNEDVKKTCYIKTQNNPRTYKTSDYNGICPDQFEQVTRDKKSPCYYLEEEKMDFTTAMDNCKAKGRYTISFIIFFVEKDLREESLLRPLLIFSSELLSKIISVGVPKSTQKPTAHSHL